MQISTAQLVEGQFDDAEVDPTTELLLEGRDFDETGIPIAE